MEVLCNGTVVNIQLLQLLNVPPLALGYVPGVKVSRLGLRIIVLWGSLLVYRVQWNREGGDRGVRWPLGDLMQ